MSFTGFGDPTIRFLKNLGRNNNRDWFQAHRAAYEDDLLEPALAFIEAIGPLLGRFSPGVHAEPRIGGSLMRINRDIRFSPDKRPYKDHLDMMFRCGEAKTSPGYWFRLTTSELTLGAGMHMLDKPELDRYRKAVDADVPGTALNKAVTKVENAGYELGGGEHYKRVPSGFPPDHPRATLLRHNGIYVGTLMEVPPEAKAATFPAFCARHYKKMLPVVDWLVTNVA
jgi:uncharacterized protein (TIGR02453 family)